MAYSEATLRTMSDDKKRRLKMRVRDRKEHEYKPYRAPNSGRLNPVSITVHMSEDTHDELIAYVRKHNVSRAEAIRLFIEWGLENDQP